MAKRSNDLKRENLYVTHHTFYRCIQFQEKTVCYGLEVESEEPKLPYDVLRPPLLPGRHTLTERIIHIFHEETHHARTDYLFSLIGQHFLIVKGRDVVKKIRRLCPVCIRERVTPAVQLMGDLPYVRLDSYTPPFSHIAIDYFGPMETSPGRA